MSTFDTGLTSDISIARLGKPGGFAPLGLDSKVPPIYLPTGLAGGLTLQGGYNASTNTPDLTAFAQQNDGALYIVTVEGTQDIGNGSELFTVGDAVFYSSGDTRWYKLESSTLSVEVAYDNGSSGLTAVNVQDAINELALAKLEDTYLKVNSTSTDSLATGTNSISIGSSAVSATNNSIVVGNSIDTGSEANSTHTINIGNNITRNPSVNLFNSIAVGNNIQVGFGGEGGAGQNSVTIGLNTGNSGDSSVVIGHNAQSDVNAVNGVAIGANAYVSGNGSIQLGAGYAGGSNSLFFRSNEIANSKGLYTSFLFPSNYTPTDADNVTSHLAAIDTEFANKQDVLPQALTVNRETITANKTLANSDEIYQHIISNTASLLVNLPASPVNGTHFIIKNASSSTQSFTTNGVSLAPGNLYEVIYDGTEWVAL